jgi:hypothetical protein
LSLRTFFPRETCGPGTIPPTIAFATEFATVCACAATVAACCCACACVRACAFACPCVARSHVSLMEFHKRWEFDAARQPPPLRPRDRNLFFGHETAISFGHAGRAAGLFVVAVGLPTAAPVCPRRAADEGWDAWCGRAPCRRGRICPSTRPACRWMQPRCSQGRFADEARDVCRRDRIVRRALCRGGLGCLRG